MITPPLFATVKDNPEIQNLLSEDGILRVFEFGNAPKKVKKPYVVWQSISGGPRNYITDRPNTEKHIIQVDCYAEDQKTAKKVKNVVEYSIEDVAKVIAYRGEEYEVETKLWRASFDVAWLIERRD